MALTLAASGERLDSLESMNDALEDRFDAICGALKGGARTVPDALAAPHAFPEPRSLVWVTACSLRALKLDPQGSAHLWFELEGRDERGARVIERGEADARLTNHPAGWRIETFSPTSSQTVHRDAPRFSEVAGQTGLIFPARDPKDFKPELVTGGLAVRDFDSDGRLDVVAADGSRLYLFRNVAGGDRGYHFERMQIYEAPKGQLIEHAAAGDFDNDGEVDLVVVLAPVAPPVVLKNAKGVFSVSGTLDRGGRLQSAVVSDLDGDGNLDLVLLPYALMARTPSSLLETTNGEPLRLYRGEGQLHFTPWVTPALPPRFSLAAMSADLLGKGRPQLYVANDFGSHDLYVFDSDGGMRNVALENHLDDPGNGMSVDVGDLDSDGHLDLYVANMFSKAGTRVVNSAGEKPEVQAKLEKFSRGNTLYLGQADGGFIERAEALGVNRGFWAWASVMFDADDDGRLEVAVADGYFSHPKRKDL